MFSTAASGKIAVIGHSISRSNRQRHKPQQPVTAETTESIRKNNSPNKSFNRTGYGSAFYGFRGMRQSGLLRAVFAKSRPPVNSVVMPRKVMVQ